MRQTKGLVQRLLCVYSPLLCFASDQVCLTLALSGLLEDQLRGSHLSSDCSRA